MVGTTNELISCRRPRDGSIPPGAGVGLKHEHARNILEGKGGVDFFEVHAENYMGKGGPPHDLLSRIRAEYPVSVHGIGLSIGGTGPLVDTEAAIARNPDIIVAAAPPGEGAAWVADWQRFPGLAAVRNHRVVVFENQALSRLGPSVLDATEELCRTIARVSRGSS